MGNILAIVGRPNVGKSTLFNRLTGMRQAIIDPTSGVTRDRHYGKSDWNGIEFSIIDTGGYITGSEDVFEDEIRKQVELAMDEADVLIMVVDAQLGITGMDEDVVNIIRRNKKKVFLAVNKVDSSVHEKNATEFYSLGFEKIYTISAINGSGTGDLLDDVTEEFKNNPEIEEELDLPKITVVGRPNVGKSSFVNALLGTERNIVTNIPGTTRDSIYTQYNSFGFNFALVDTAGIRRKSKVSENIEFYSVMRSIRAIEHSDVCILILDATQGIEQQDLNIFHLIERNRKGVVIMVNKWDLVEKQTNTHKEFEEAIRKRIAPFNDVPIIFTSVLTKQRIFKVLEDAIRVFNNLKRTITTSELNEWLLPIIEQTPPPATKGKFIRIKYITQLKTKSPAFAFFANLPQYVKDPYKRFIENQLRNKYDFTGAPLQIYIRKK